MTQGPLHAALLWLQSALLGTVATSLAMLGVAVVGFLLLQGRIDMRRAATVVCGCFILFGAPAIASGLIGLLSIVDPGPFPQLSAMSAPVARAPVPPPVTEPANSGYDPYAGAAVHVK